MPGFAINCDSIHAPSLILLSNREFRRAFHAALKGEKNVFSPFMKRWNDRPPAHEWRLLRSAVFERDNYTCGYCAERGGKLECDHIIPVSRGGSNDIKNLITACKPCNRAKAGKLISEWAR